MKLTESHPLRRAFATPSLTHFKPTNCVSHFMSCFSSDLRDSTVFSVKRTMNQLLISCEKENDT